MKFLWGRKLTKEKSQLFFSPNTDPHVQQEIKNLLGVGDATNYEKYLGLPSLVGRAKK